VAWPGVTIGCAVLEAVLVAQALGLGAAGRGLVRERRRGGLAQQGVVAAAGALVGGLVVVDGVPGAQAATRRAHDLGPRAAGGAGPLTVGTTRRRLALLALLLAPVLALAGAIPTGPVTLAALLVPVRPPLLTAGALLPAALALPATVALAGAVGGLLAVQEPDFPRGGNLTLLDLEVIEPNLVKVQGIWICRARAVIITDSRISFLDPERREPISIIGERASSILKWSGPISAALFSL
jgi:hypothetical protein